jgi:beta-glucosidase
MNAATTTTPTTIKSLRKQHETRNEDRLSSSTPLTDDVVVQRWLNDMTTADMIGQMSQIDINLLVTDDGNGGKHLKPETVERYIGEMGIGSVLNTVGSAWTARQYREAAIAINQVAANYSRPPVIWGLDSVHGANYVHGAVLTPQPLNLAATFNVSMVHAAGALASRDTRAAGIHWLFAPLLGLAVEPRWSRVYETFGEDPVVVGAMAAAMIQGIQTPEQHAVPSRAAACGKHFVGYSMPRTGHDRSPSWIPTRHLYQYFVPPWKKAVSDAVAVLTVMESYTETDGVPIVANREALDYLLRQRLRFAGVVVTDYEEIRNLHNWHHVAASDEEAVIQSLQEQGSGIDMSMIPWDADGFAASIVSGLQKQRIAMDRIRTSAARVLQLKHDLRMFDETITIVEPNLDRIGTDEADVLPMVQDSLILAQNNGNLLPLNTSKPLKVHITGPTANSLTRQSGGWTWQWQGAPSEEWFTYGSTVWESLQAVKSWSVTYSCGVDVLGKECEDPDETDVDESTNIIDQVKHWVGLTPTTSMAKAVEAAKVADITVICVGEEAYAEKPGDIRSLRLPDGQNDLVHAIQRNTDTKILLVYFGGRPRLLSDMVDNVDAVILGFLPGPSAGQAVVGVVTGLVNPSGRLPITYPAAEDGGGVPYWHAVTDKCTHGDEGTPMPHYEYVPCPVQWPFGHGLSYTSFEYSDLSAIGGIDDDLHMTVTVTNTGTRAGADAVMFFTFDEFRQTTPAYKRLRAFEKVSLAAGESVTIKTTVPVDELRFVGHHDDRHYILDPHMISYLGVGYMTDCRLRDNDHNPDENDLCVRLQSQAANKPYVAACGAACNLWKDSGCGSTFGMSDKQCSEMCMAINQSGPMSSATDGWGWNYVNCLESVVWGMEQQQHKTDQCPMMTAMCRDIFQTGQSTEFGVGMTTSDANARGAPPGYWLALMSALLASVMMVQLLRGAFATRRQQPEEESFNGIQFSPIRNHVVDG